MNVDNEESKHTAKKETHHEDKLKINQDLSFLSTVIPQFIFTYFAKIGVAELNKFFFEQIIKLSLKEIKEIWFGMYSWIRDPQKQKRKYTKEGMLLVKLDKPIIGKTKSNKQNYITEGMLYKIIESPIWLLIKDDIGSMIEMCRNRNPDISIYNNSNDLDEKSPNSSKMNLNMNNFK